MSIRGRTIVLAGATSSAGVAVARGLIAAGAQVIATGRNPSRLGDVAATGATVHVSDATSFAAMTGLAATIGPVDGVIPLVGGWAGGGGLAGQDDDSFRMLLPALDAARATSRAFDTAVKASPAGRFAVVSSTVVAHPTASGANYATVKAATETWTHAVAQSYAKQARDAGTALHAAAVIFRAAGALDPAALTQAIIRLWNTDATKLNNTTIELG